MFEINVYTTNDDPLYEKTIECIKDVLGEEDFNTYVRVLNIAKNEISREFLLENKINCVPVVRCNNYLIVGYDPEKIEKYINKGFEEYLQSKK